MRSKLTRREVMAAGIAGLAGSSALAAGSRGMRGEESPGRKRVLRFAHLTDAHVQEERGGAEGLAAALRHVQSLADPPEMVMFGGDNVMDVDSEGGMERAPVQLALWNSVLRDECSLPWRTAIGNHDVLMLDPVDGKKWAAEAYGLSERYYSFDRAGWRFIVLDSTEPQPEGGYKGRLDEVQLGWLREMVAQTPATTPICIVSHIPILAVCSSLFGQYEKTGDWVTPGALRHVDGRVLKDLFHAHGNVRLCLSGHIHLVDRVEYLGVRYACNGAVSGAWWRGAWQEFEPGYAIVDLYDDGSSQIERVTFGWETRP